jgi:hypothetical protein
VTRGCRATAAACVAALLLGPGCARLVTLDPETVASRNDVAWRVSAPPRPPAAAAPPEAPSPAANGAVTPVPSPPPAPAPQPEAAAVAPLTFRARPEVQNALLTPPDELGIPTGLYAVDPLLADHRREMESQAHSRRAVGGGTIAFGAVFAGLAGLAIGVGAANVHSPDPQQSSAAEQSIAWGSVLAALSLAQIIAGIALTASDSDPRPLERYYRETYTDAR